jgi:hypothetical protein
LQVIHNFAKISAEMGYPERSDHVLHQASGDIFVTITEQSPKHTKAEVIFSSPEGGSPGDFKAILEVVDAAAPKKEN